MTVAEAMAGVDDRGVTDSSPMAPGRPPVTAESIVRLLPLSMRADRGSWIIGNADTGDFVQVPDIAHQILLMLDGRRAVGDISHALTSGGEPADVAGFIEDLADLGFIDAIDDHLMARPDPPRPTLRWLKPAGVRWTLHPATALVAFAIIAAGIGCLAAHPQLAPTYRNLVWSRWSGVVLAGNMATAWMLIFLHELSHLATARGAGVPARLSLGTRLQFLTAQTDVTGVWTQPRRVRLTVYLAGMVLDLVIAALGLILLATAGGSMPAVAYRLVEATILLAVLSLPVELFVFMRTDMYFLIQDLTGCLSLYSDGSAYFWYLVGSVAHLMRLRATRPTDPSLALDRGERRAVRVYSVVIVLGTAACLAVAVTAELPAAVLLLGRALGNLTAGPLPARLGNGTALAGAASGLILWARAWWQCHGQRVRRLLRSRHPQTRGGDAP